MYIKNPKHQIAYLILYLIPYFNLHPVNNAIYSTKQYFARPAGDDLSDNICYLLYHDSASLVSLQTMQGQLR